MTETEQRENRAPDASPLNGIAPPVEHRFKPGQSGNPKGRPISKPLTEALKTALAADNGAAIQELVAVAVKKARQGDFRFWREILDRVDGKVTDRLEVTGDPIATMGPEFYASVEKIEKMLTEGPARPYHPEYDALKGRGAKP